MAGGLPICAASASGLAVADNAPSARKTGELAEVLAVAPKSVLMRVVGSALKTVESALAGRRVEIRLDPALPLVEFDATLVLKREPITHASLARALASFPLVTLKVSSLIYWQALRLWLKRTPFFTHPDKVAT